MRKEANIIKNSSQENSRRPLRESEEKYRNILETIQDGYYESDIAGNYTFFNDSLCNILGYPRDELMGMNYKKRMDQENAGKVYSAFSKVYETELPSNGIDWQIIRKDGSRAFIDTSISLIKNAEGQRTGFRGIIRDVTGRKQMEELLRASQETLSQIVNGISIPTFVIDSNHVITHWNKACENIIGVPGAEMIGTNKQWSPFYGEERPLMADLVVDGVTEEEMATLYGNKYLKSDLIKGAYETESFFPDLGEKGLWLFFSATPLRDPKGKVVGAIETFQDMTERRKAEEELKKSNAELEKILAELQATHAQMLMSEKMASVGQLAAGVAHEINNPTGFVSSNLKTLQDYQSDMNRLLIQYRKIIADLKGSNLPSSIKEQAELITKLEAEVDIDFILGDIQSLIKDCREGTERIKKIVLDLKDFAHPGEDKLQAADINKGIESTLNVVWNELKYKATVKKEYGDLPIVKCYPQQLNQVFMNIFVNAAQAIEEHGEITISTSADDEYIEIRISDNGTGIAEENLSRLFDPFFTTKEVGKGTGLGLNVAYNIIQKHNGRIDVESEVGKGTTFRIRIPAH